MILILNVHQFFNNCHLSFVILLRLNLPAIDET